MLIGACPPLKVMKQRIKISKEMSFGLLGVEKSWNNAGPVAANLNHARLSGVIRFVLQI